MFAEPSQLSAQGLSTNFDCSLAVKCSFEELKATHSDSNINLKFQSMLFVAIICIFFFRCCLLKDTLQKMLQMMVCIAVFVAGRYLCGYLIPIRFVSFVLLFWKVLYFH